MKKFKGLFLNILFCLSASYLSAASYYVTTAGISTNDGLSWASPLTLDAALALVVDDDVINIGAGTYTPAVWLTNGNAAADATFEIKKNISIVGGYPTSPMNISVPSSANITLFSGFQTCNHVVAVTAPVVSGKKVTLSNISITGGKSAASGTAVSINTLTYNRTYGAALTIGAATVELNNCRLYENTGNHAQGVLAFGAATVTLNNCSIDNNTGIGNGTGVWNDNSIVTLNNCTVSNNSTTGTCAGIYAVNTTKVSKTYMYNTTISNNTAATRTAYYGREKSEGIMVNCTVYGNSCTNATTGGAGISLYSSAAGSATTAVKLDIINTTITNNTNSAAETSGGIRVNDAYCTLNIYNSIVSGNTVGAVGSKVTGDIMLLNSGTYTKKNTIISNKAYDAAGTEVAGQTFDYATMLDALATNGGITKTCKLLLTEEVNPAKTLGMSSVELTSLGGLLTPVIPESIISYDQLGNLRSGRVIGAWTANGTATDVVGNKELKNLLIFKEGTDICVVTKFGDRVSVYTVSGQRVFQANAISNLTKIKNISKGNIYIVNVNGLGVKVVL